MANKKWKMTESQERHLEMIKESFETNVDRKYRKGAEEHACDIRERTAMELLDESLAECIDQFTYLVSLRDKLTGEEDAQFAIGKPVKPSLRKAKPR